jgi:transcription elongation factor Elf1
MNLLEATAIQCPYCGEEIDILIDVSIENQEYVEDCQVCCKPIEIAVISEDNGIVSLSVHTDND